MTRCSSCGSKGYGLFGDMAKRTCTECKKTGCDKCLHLFIESNISRRRTVGKHHIFDAVGFCSKECLKNAIRGGRIKLNISPRLDEKRYYLYVYGDDDMLLPEFYVDYMRIIAEEKNISMFVYVLSKYADKPLAQGLLTMFEGYKSLDYEKIIKGIQLCRNDDLYHHDTEIKSSIDSIAKDYVEDLKCYDVPTSKVTMGNVTVTLTIPKGKNEMRIFACPSCGSPLNKIAVRGQVVKCDHCGGVFEAV